MVSVYPCNAKIELCAADRVVKYSGERLSVVEINTQQIVLWQIPKATDSSALCRNIGSLRKTIQSLFEDFGYKTTIQENRVLWIAGHY